MEDTSQGELDQFFSGYGTFNFKKGEIILRAGDPIPGIYYLKRGFVRLFTQSREGQKLTLIIFRKGDIFPISWAVNTFSRDMWQRYWLESLTGCELKRCAKVEFVKFIKAKPEALFDLATRISERLNGLLIRTESIVFGTAASRIASILLICAQRFGKKTEKGMEIQVPLTHSDIASLIGVARETASIEIKKLERLGLVGYRGRLMVVINEKRLKREIVN